MQFQNEFVVPVPPARAWDVLLDMPQVARCLPGATLQENDGQRFAGKMKVKVGPITVGYKGSAEFVEKDVENYRAVVKASGREERGAGTAGATITAQLHPTEDDRTRVQVLTDLDITGKPAQFGRGVMEEVGAAIIGQFAKRLAAQIQDGPSAAAEATPATAPATPPTAGGQDAPAAGSPTVASHEQDHEDDALDMGLLAWKPVLKRVAPAVAGVLGGFVLGRLFARSPKTPHVVVLLCPAGERPHVH